jgi:hypothetical protein
MKEELMKMKKIKIQALVLAAVMLFSVNAFAAAGCVQTYMDALEECIHISDFIRANICHADATIEYVGCIKKVLIF